MNTPVNADKEPRTAIRATWHFKSELSLKTAYELAEQLNRLDAEKVVYIGVHLLRPILRKGEEVPQALPRIWVNVSNETGTPFIYTSGNWIFAVKQDGTLGDAEIVR